MDAEVAGEDAFGATMNPFPEGVVETGVFATKEEIAEARRPRPVMFLSGGTPMGESANQYVHRIALAHGLPEIRGYYGMSPEGEFVRTE